MSITNWACWFVSSSLYRDGILCLRQLQWFRRRIRANGSVQVDKHVYYVDAKLAGQSVLVQVDAHQQCLWVLLDGKPLPNSLPLKDLHSGLLELYSYLRLLQHEARSIAHYREMMWQRSADVA